MSLRNNLHFGICHPEAKPKDLQILRPLRQAQGPQNDMGSSGFTLIEVLISIVILASGIVLVVQALGRTQDILRISQNLIRASQIAEEHFADAEIELREHRKLTTSSREGEEREAGRLFRWSRTVNPFRGEGIEDETRLSQVDVTIEWKEGSTRENKETLSSILLNRDKKEEKKPA